MANQEETFDDALAAIAAQAGGLEPLMNAFFGFLHRRTDFYVQFDNQLQNKEQYDMGFPPGYAEKLVINSFKKNPFRTAVPKKKAVALKVVSPPIAKDQMTISKKEIRYSEGKQIPIGNGGIGHNYYWTQSLKDLTIYVDAEHGVRGKNIVCDIQARRFLLKVHNDTVIDGALEEAIKIDESMWTVATSSHSAQIVITLEKCVKTWWKHAIVGDPEIDTSKVYIILLFQYPDQFYLI